MLVIRNFALRKTKTEKSTYYTLLYAVVANHSHKECGNMIVGLKKKNYSSAVSG